MPVDVWDLDLNLDLGQLVSSMIGAIGLWRQEPPEDMDTPFDPGNPRCGAQHGAFNQHPHGHAA